MSCKISLKREDEYEERVIALIFESKMKWGEQDVFAYSILYTLSYHRPRWAVQLCKLAQEHAITVKFSKIQKSNIDAIWGEYGKKRIADLVSEHKHQRKDVEELINSFRGCERLLTREELFSWIKSHIESHMNVFIEGNQIKSYREFSHFLYRIGFIVARPDGNDGKYEHYHFNEMSDLLSSRTNNNFDMKWEIHPCYRQPLDIKKLNLYQRMKRICHK
jgi:hypothetical protein